jgi:type IX secretion system PorP/SprF family membrane protein
MYNTLGVNPAYAGSRDALTITALHRSQWVGFDGAPQTQTLTVHTPVLGDAVNLGLSLINDKVGPVHTTGLYLDYAFRFNVTEKSKLAFGLKVGFNNYSSDLESLHLANPDLSFTEIESTFSPNVGFGVYYSMDRFYAGLSTPKLFQNNYIYSQTNSGDNLAKEARHYYLILGGLVHLTKDVDLKPTTFVKIVTGAPIEGDFTANFILYDKLILGAMYRTGDAIGLLTGFNITDQLNIGYSFDWSFLNTTGKYNYGSHEVMLRYDFIYKDKRRIRSPRYF